jgi:hypothetical protein
MCLKRHAILLAVVLSLTFSWIADAFDQKDEKTAVALKRPDAKQLEALWADLASEDAAKAYVALRALAERPAQAVALLSRHLKPVPAPDPQTLAGLVKDLGSKRAADRDKAMKQLRHLGGLAAPALREALKGKPTPEVRKRIEELLQALEGRVIDREALRAVRSVEVLERVGTKEAKDLMRKLAKGAAGARLTQECQDSLRRLEQRP